MLDQEELHSYDHLSKAKEVHLQAFSSAGAFQKN